MCSEVNIFTEKKSKSFPPHSQLVLVQHFLHFQDWKVLVICNTFTALPTNKITFWWTTFFPEIPYYTFACSCCKGFTGIFSFHTNFRKKYHFRRLLCAVAKLGQSILSLFIMWVMKSFERKLKNFPLSPLENIWLVTIVSLLRRNQLSHPLEILGDYSVFVWS